MFSGMIEKHFGFIAKREWFFLAAPLLLLTLAYLLSITVFVEPCSGVTSFGMTIVFTLGSTVGTGFIFRHRWIWHHWNQNKAVKSPYFVLTPTKNITGNRDPYNQTDTLDFEGMVVIIKAYVPRYHYLTIQEPDKTPRHIGPGYYEIPVISATLTINLEE